jgi:hypothetical protein
MKRTFLTLTAIGALAVPVGLATAQSDDIGTETTPPTTVECDHDQLRLRDGSGDQLRQRLHTEECSCQEGDQVRTRTEARLEDGSGEQVRTQARLEDGSGDRTQAQDGSDVPVGSQDRVRLQDPTQLQDHVRPGTGQQARQGR